MRPETVEMLSGEDLSEEAAQTLTRLAKMIMDHEANNRGLQVHSCDDIQRLRSWLCSCKLKIDAVIERFDIDVSIEAHTVGTKTSLSIKFWK